MLNTIDQQCRDEPFRLRNQLVRGGIGMVALKTAGMALLLGTSMILARVLGTEGFGIYSYVLAVISLFGLPVSAGIPTLLIREVAAYHAKREHGRLRGLIRRANQAALVSAIIVALVGTGVSFHGGIGSLTPQTATFVCGFVLLPVLALSKIRGAILTGLSRVVLGQCPEYLITPLALLTLIVVLQVLGITMSPVLTMAMHVCAAAAAFGIGHLVLLRFLPATVRQSRPEYEDRRWIRSTAPLAVIAGISVLNSHMDIAMLGVMTTPHNVAIYRVAAQIAAVVSFGIMAINAVISPHIARLYTMGDMKRLQRMVTVSSRVSLIITAAVMLGLLASGRWLIGVAFGVAYTDSFMPTIVLGMGQVCVVMLGSTMTIATMTGHERPASRIMMLGLAPNVVMNLVLIPRYGAIGAAWSSVASLVVWRVALFGRVRSWLGIDTSVIGASLDVKRQAITTA